MSWSQLTNRPTITLIVYSPLLRIQSKNTLDLFADKTYEPIVRLASFKLKNSSQKSSWAAT